MNVDYLLYSLIIINSPLSIFSVYFASREPCRLVFTLCAEIWSRVKTRKLFVRRGWMWWKASFHPWVMEYKSWNQTKPEALIMCFWRDLINRKIKEEILKNKATQILCNFLKLYLKKAQGEVLLYIDHAHYDHLRYSVFKFVNTFAIVCKHITWFLRKIVLEALFCKDYCYVFEGFNEKARDLEGKRIWPLKFDTIFRHSSSSNSSCH